MLIVNEFGIYEAVFESRKKEAKEFKRWVFEMLKSLNPYAKRPAWKVFRYSACWIRNIKKAVRNCKCSESFSLSNFRPSKYKDNRGKHQPEILMTKNGFAFVAMGFTGKKAAE